MAGIQRIRFNLAGEGPPEEKLQQLKTSVTLLNLFRIDEVAELAKSRGDAELAVISVIVNAALDQYFEQLPEPDKQIVNANAHHAIEFVVAQEARRAK